MTSRIPDGLKTSRRSTFANSAAFTLIETVVAMGVLSMLLAGILAALLQSRRLTEGSIYQNSAVTIVQGYLEQIKNMEFNDLPYTDAAGNLYRDAVLVPADTPATDPLRQIATRLDDLTPDTLVISTGPIPILSGLNLTDTPTGVVNNVKIIDINQTTSTTDDLNLNLWIWIQDVSNTTSPDATDVRAITIVYTYQVNDGGRVRRFRDSIRSIRSAVPTF